MQNQYIQHGSTTPSVDVTFINPTTGLPRTDLTNATAGLTLCYRRPGAAKVDITLASQTVGGAYTAGGFVHTAALGVYRLDLPTAAVLTGVDRVTLGAAALPTDVMMIPVVVALGPDSAASAALTDTTIMSTLAGAGGATAREAIADTFLGRAIAGGSNAGRLVRDVFRLLRNKVTVSGGTMTVRTEDDTTTAWTAAVTTTPGANPITDIDPT